MSHGAQLCRDWQRLRQVYRDSTQTGQRPRPKAECLAAWAEANRAWRAYAKHQESLGLPVEP